MVHHHCRLRELPWYRFFFIAVIGLWILGVPTVGILAQAPGSTTEITITMTVQTMPLPLAPTNFTTNQTGAGTINLSWTKGLYANTTIIRISKETCAINYTEGHAVYNSTGNWTLYEGLLWSYDETSESFAETYCLRAWSYNTIGYSLGFAEIKVGGETMLLLFLGLFGLGFLGLGFTYKQMMLAFLAGFVFIGLSVVGWTNTVETYDVYWLVGLLGILALFVSFVSGFLIQRKATADQAISQRRLDAEFPTPTVLTEEEAYRQELNEELNPVRRANARRDARRVVDSYKD